MRLGAYPCKLVPGSKAHQAYAADLIHERHRHRYEMNNAYCARFEQAGMLVTGASPGGELVEIIELADHPWFLAVQCHPEFKSKPTGPHPLFHAFVQAGLAHREQSRKADGGRSHPQPNHTAASGS
jgi:CTP synthase